MPEVVVAQGPEQVSELAADFIVRLIKGSARLKFHIALSGGKTPGLLYRCLTGPRCSDEIPWSKLHFWWGDERVVSSESPDSNFRLAQETLIERAPIDEGQIHRIEVELGADKAAASYERELIQAFGDRVVFDLVLLGVGKDGHTASIFPDSLGQLPQDRHLATTVGGEPPLERVTLTFKAINAARQVVVFVTGASKRDIIQRVLMGDERLPASLIEPGDGDRCLHFFLDKAAAAGLDKG